MCDLSRAQGGQQSAQRVPADRSESRQRIGRGPADPSPFTVPRLDNIPIRTYREHTSLPCSPGAVMTRRAGRKGRGRGRRTGLRLRGGCRETGAADVPADVGQTRHRRWRAGRRFLAFPPGSHPDGISEGAPSDGTRNPVLSGVRLRPGAGLAILRLPHGGPRKPPGASRRSIPSSEGDGKAGDDGQARSPTKKPGGEALADAASLWARLSPTYSGDNAANRQYLALFGRYAIAPSHAHFRGIAGCLRPNP